ncbi:unnamed protein product, partial [Rotaria magnacalcarata]
LKMKTLLVIVLGFLMIIQQKNYNVLGGSLAGFACCTTELLVPVLGWASFSVCEPICLASFGTASPCTSCAVTSLAPTP